MGAYDAGVRVSTRGDYASRALLSLALHGGDTPVSVRDIVDALNEDGARALPVPPVPPDAPPPYIDVSGDDQVSPLDALMVINYINEHAAAQAVPEPPAGVLALGMAVLLVVGGLYGHRRRRRRLAWARVPRHGGRGQVGPGGPDGR